MYRGEGVEVGLKHARYIHLHDFSTCTHLAVYSTDVGSNQYFALKATCTMQALSPLHSSRRHHSRLLFTLIRLRAAAAAAFALVEGTGEGGGGNPRAAVDQGARRWGHHVGVAAAGRQR